MKVPLYRLQGHGDHFYTTSAEERDNAVAHYGYAIEGIACYVDDAPEPPAPVMTMRDMLAASVIGHIVASRMIALSQCNEDAETHARLAYIHADAMLKVRGE